MKVSAITVQNVDFMPKQLEPGILYVSQKYGTAAHLCACGCGEKIRTPLGPTEWGVTGSDNYPNMWPSVGNWQKACRSHYVIQEGKIIWCGAWTPAQIVAGRQQEERRRRAHYNQMYARKSGLQAFLRWLKNLFQNK
jgi:hypothetical protein